MTTPTSIRACRDCGYNLAGLESVRCPECGGDIPFAQPPDHDAARSVAASRGLSCRHCKRPLSEMVEGVCGCGATYQLASAVHRPRRSSDLSIIDGVTVIAAIIGCAISLLAFIFTGTARNSDPKWGVVILSCIPAIGLFLAITLRPVSRKLSAETRSIVGWFFVVISFVCLIGAVVLLS